MNAVFAPRSVLRDYEWDPAVAVWRRPPLDGEVLRRLSERSTANGLWRFGVFLLLLLASASATLWAARTHLVLALPLLYVYYFFSGFWVAVGHELQHKMVFARSFDAVSETLFFIVQTMMWNSPRYARISHQLHHRYTMVRGTDPETDWPEPITSRWLRRYFLQRVSSILFVGALYDLGIAVRTQIRRIVGVRDRMMREHCTPNDITVIRLESAAILLIHLGVIAAAIAYSSWALFLMVTMAWHVGWAIEGMWHQTEHIGRCYRVNDQRLCTRSVRVNPFLKLIYWGLDDHVDHHLFPAVPARHLPKLHELLKKDLPEPLTMVQNWREMFAIAREKDRHPDHEFIPINLNPPVPAPESPPASQARTARPKSAAGNWKCAVCGFVYHEAAGLPRNGIPSGTRFEDLPDNWRCPTCGASKDEFHPV